MMSWLCIIVLVHSSSEYSLDESVGELQLPITFKTQSEGQHKTFETNECTLVDLCFFLQEIVFAMLLEITVGQERCFNSCWFVM